MKINNNLSRRRFIQSVATLSTMSAASILASDLDRNLLHRKINISANTNDFDEEFIIVNNWVLLASDIAT